MTSSVNNILVYSSGDQAVTIGDVLKVWRAEPFRPFSLFLTGGRRVKVSRSDGLARSPTGRELAVALPDDTHVRIPLSEVTEIRVHKTPRGQANGRRKR